MLRYKFRFHGYGSLKYVYKNGVAKRSRVMTVKSVVNPRRDTPRFSVVVSKKVLKSAVGRNRIRRRVYEVIRHEIPHMHQNYDTVVIITLAEVRTMPHEELVATVQDLFAQLELYPQFESI